MGGKSPTKSGNFNQWIDMKTEPKFCPWKNQLVKGNSCGYFEWHFNRPFLVPVQLLTVNKELKMFMEKSCETTCNKSKNDSTHFIADIKCALNLFNDGFM